MKTRFKGKKALLLLPFILLAGDGIAQRYAGPLSPEESLKKLNVANGFSVQLFASEPHVFDPVALEFDEQGNAYVIEMPDYPYEVEPGKGHGRIRILKDTNGDGKIDKSIIFAENVTEATSMLPWKGGLIVTAAPNILYLKDTNGDGKSDSSEILFSGFFQNNSEAQVTSLKLGVDNWIYANNRGQSGKVTFSKTPGAAPVEVRGADFRFRMDRNVFELETGPGQFGQTIDDWGHRFFTENSIHLQQAVIPWRYTHRHAFLPTSKFNVSITDHEEIMFQETAPAYWRAERSARRNKMYKEANLTRIEYAEDRFTGASGGTIYNGDALPKEFYGNVFTSDVSGHLVHRDILSPSETSPVLVAKRPESEKNREFIYSTDTWFRPVTFSVGPDGYLYILDYYRQHIETPVSIPDDLKADMDFMAGSDMGRIYRVLPTNSTYKSVSVNLKDVSSIKLLDFLSHNNGWYRTQAQRLLLERQDKSVVPIINNLFSKSADPRTRLHLLYVLEGLNSLNAGIIRKGLQDSSPGVRENALMLAERYPETLPLVLKLINDPSKRVALQAALSLGEFKGQAIIPAFSEIVQKQGQNDWFRSAVLSSEAGSSAEILKVLAMQKTFFQNPEPWKLSFLQDLSNIIAARNNKSQVSSYLNVMDLPAMSSLNLQTAALKGLKLGLNKNEALKETAEKLSTDSETDVKASFQLLNKLY
ncbi:putative membrane-bound dehydrogenase domain-containing protein [Daejeonella rubra]|uniref:Putative membrane-bound dehydrogenase domain-containing protein n=1 Tax=Daejeonella rubra TaxID=990371 RepID=A0A1G9S5U1_9SPHI|nr:PVC-type heme-binding CxxCH protein [Daejeonella rubra]SDM30670.1 putative membrane-bound dehydrogenase domain-containing protein [Daejeonella rubra]